MSNLVASKVPFFDLANLLEKINLSHNAKYKKLSLLKFIDSWRKYHFMLHKDDKAKTTDSFYPALRLILPECERERVAYGIKESNLAHLYIKTLSLPKDGEDALKLLNYKQEMANDHTKNYEDFADIAYHVLENRCPEYGKLSISDVNHHLDNIAINKATKNKEMVTKNILQLIQNTSALEQKWLIRMILKRLSIGLGQITILNLFHPDAEALFNVTNDLEKVCLTLRDPKIRTADIGIQLFTPFKPMLAERSSHKLILDLIVKKGEAFYLETKFDGERMQVHYKDGHLFRYFSRRGYDYTASYGPTKTEGIFTPLIVDCFGMDVQSCILDGEMVGFHKPTKTIGHKGPFFDIKYITEDSDYQPCYCAFDLLYLNGKLMTTQPLHERKDVLGKKFKALPGTFMVVDWWKAYNEEDILLSLSRAVESREEGIMVKDPDSIYIPNDRKCGWFKVKPDYVQGLMDSLDLLLVGAYYGNRKRHKGRKRQHHQGPAKDGKSEILTHFLLAAKCPNQSEPEMAGAEQISFIPVCVIGSGFSNKELYHLLTTLQTRFKPFNSSEVAANSDSNPKILFSLRGYRPDVWIEPEKSVILQVKASRIQLYPAKKSGGPKETVVKIDETEERLLDLKPLSDDTDNKIIGLSVLGEELKSPLLAIDVNAATCENSYVSLKFPRLERVRYDKSFEDCMSLQELIDLEHVASSRDHDGFKDKYRPLQLVSRMYRDNATPGQDGSGKRGRKRIFNLVSHARPLKLANNPVQIKSHIFDGMEFCIVNGSESLSKPEMEKECVERGAKIVQNPGPESTYVIAGMMNAKINNFISSQKYDIAKASWLSSCIEKERLLQCTPIDMIYATPEKKSEFAGKFDAYGDSYCDPVDAAQIKIILDHMTIDPDQHLTPKELENLKMQLKNIDY